VKFIVSFSGFFKVLDSNSFRWIKYHLSRY